MVQLGNICNSHGDRLKVVELWTTTRPLFEMASQVKEVQCVDERLACVGRDVLEQHRENMALSPIKDMEQVVDEPLIQL